MKILVEIPTEDFHAIQFNNAEELGVEFAQEVFDRIVVSEEIIDRDFSAIKRKCIVCPHCATCNISENPTNGDMIKAMFPHVEIKDNCDMYYSVNIENLSIDTGLNTVGFRKDWWNAPYKLERSN